MTHSDELVERVARAIIEARFADDNDGYDMPVTDYDRDLARAALSAMPGHDDFDEREARAGAAIMLAKTHRLTLLEELLREALEALDALLAEEMIYTGGITETLEASEMYPELTAKARAAAEKIRASLTQDQP